MKKIVLTLLFCFFATQATAVTLQGGSYGNLSMKRKPKLMLLGDSITLGTGNTPFGYREYLQDDLLPLKYDFVGQYTDPDTDPDHDVDHSAVSGDDRTDIASRISSELTTHFPDYNSDDVIVIFTGTNDTLGAAPPYTTHADYIETNIIDVIHAHNPDINVYVVLIPPTTHGTNQSRIDTWNTAISTMVSGSSKTNLSTINVHDSFENVSNCATVGDCLADSLHPNATGHGLIATDLAAGIKTGEGF